MCNSYRITPKRGAGVRDKISAAAAELASSLVRKSDPGVVVLAGEKVEIMRWGFHRSFNAAVNNARAEKLESGMWQAALHQRRCIIPMSQFYEWGPPIAGSRKQAYEFHDPADDYLWVAGIWEENEELGPCYSMVTTAASPLMAPIHDRMPAVLRPEEAAEFLAGTKSWDFQPFAGSVVVMACESPLSKPQLDPQAELF